MTPDFKKDMNAVQNFFWGKIPKKIRFFIGVVILCVGIVVGYVRFLMPNEANQLFISEKNGQKVELTNSNVSGGITLNGDGSSSKDDATIQVLGVQSDCELPLETNFSDNSRWIAEQWFFIPEETGSHTYCPQLTEKNPVRVTYLDCSLGLPYSVELTAVPRSLEHSNIIIQYENIFRCIIGDGNYLHIACEEWSPREKNYHRIREDNSKIETPRLNGDIGVAPQTAITTIVSVKGVKNTNTLNVELVVSYIPADSPSLIKKKNFKYTIHLDRNSADVSSHIGIGMIDNDYKGDVCIEPLNLKLFD
ncbi:MAG: hypothetical protein V1846_03360 [Candidatus Komeilibacteria bacterium]